MRGLHMSTATDSQMRGAIPHAFARRAFVRGALGAGMMAAFASSVAARSACAGEAADSRATDGVARAASGEADGTPGASHAGRAGTVAGLASLPASDPDPASPFGVDRAVNVGNIDQYLNRPDVAYRDCRMLFDPADWWSMNGNPDLATALEGFRIVPMPYLVTLPPLPVSGAYDGDALFTAAWDENGEIASLEANYRESRQALDDLYPKDRPVFLVCGGGGYAGFTKKLLTYLGWDPSLLYNIGGMWDYKGDRLVHIIEYGETEADDLYAMWRADYADIDFSLLRPTQA